MSLSRRWKRTVCPVRSLSPTAMVPLLVVELQDVADEVVPLAEIFLQLGGCDADVQGPPQQLLVLLPEAVVEIDEGLDRGAPVQLREEVAAASGHRHRLADGAAALGDHRVDGDRPLEGGADAAARMHATVEKEAVTLQARGEAPRPWWRPRRRSRAP